MAERLTVFDTAGSRVSMAILGATLLLLVACGGGVSLPDRTTAEVQAEEARIAELLQTTTDVWAPGVCQVRLLGQDGTTSYAYTKCSDGSSGGSMPVRIDGERASAPGDGSFYSPDVKRMFPADLAKLILNRDERIFP